MFSKAVTASPSAGPAALTVSPRRFVISRGTGGSSAATGIKIGNHAQGSVLTWLSACGLAAAYFFLNAEALALPLGARRRGGGCCSRLGYGGAVKFVMLHETYVPARGEYSHWPAVT
jgi:hypothetical protein